MKKNYLKLISQAFFILMINACAHLKKNTTMVEKFNFEAVEGRTTGIVVQNGEWLIDIGSVIFMTQWEYAPAIDEDAKFGKIKPHHFVEILEKIGWINRKTAH